MPDREDREAPRHGAADGGETVLIVEDDPVVRRLVSSQVSGLGYRVIAAADGHAAIAVLRGTGQVDLLFTDITMDGGMDGIDLAHLARACRPNLAVLFTSGDGGLHAERLAAAGALLLTKPYRKRDLAEHLRRALAG